VGILTVIAVGACSREAEQHADEPHSVRPQLGDVAEAGLRHGCGISGCWEMPLLR